MTQRLRVVIVEDVAADAELMALRLLEAGYQADWLRVDLEEDFLATLEGPPDLILADWALPRFSGKRALELTRARGLDVPFIIVSGSIGEEAAVDALRAGANDYVWKDRPVRLGPAVRRAFEERELRAEWRRNQESLLLLTRAVEHSPVSVVITGRSGDIEYVNPKFTEISGYTYAEVQGRNPRFLKSGEMPASFYRELWETITGGGEWRGEFHNRRKDGTLFWERASISPVRDSNGAITHFVALKEDVTAQKVLEGEFLQAQKMESIGRLAGGIAHDFNNLLTVINGYGDLVLKGLPEGDPLRGPVAEMRIAGEQAAQLTKQLLAFSRKQIIAPKPLNLNRVVSGTESLLRRLLGEDIELIVELEPALGTVLADTGQLQQVLLNLTVNARDAMPGGGTLTIKTANLESDGSHPATPEGFVPDQHVLLAVSDTGIGMDKATLSHLFEPFFTTKPPGVGTGLGLSTAYGIVYQFGGEISVSSEPGCGTEFRVYLPRIEAQPAEEEAGEAVPLSLAGSETILVVEDQPVVAELVAGNLTGYGYQALVALGCEQALGIAESHSGPIHLLLTDVVMPHMTGKDLAGRFSLLRPSAKVLYMSGFTHDVIATRDVLKGNVEFIAKPFTAQELATKVRTVLGPPVQAGPASSGVDMAHVDLHMPAQRRARVVVADDEAGVRRFLKKTLEDGGYEVLEATNGKQALVAARTGQVDLVITDLVMPEQEGLETIRTLRKEVAGIGIIAISGAFRGEYLKPARRLGADAALNKPVSAELLLATVAEVLKARR